MEITKIEQVIWETESLIEDIKEQVIPPLEDGTEVKLLECKIPKWTKYGRDRIYFNAVFKIKNDKGESIRESAIFIDLKKSPITWFTQGYKVASPSDLKIVDLVVEPMILKLNNISPNFNDLVTV